MATLKLATAVVATVFSSPGTSQTVLQWRPYITEASLRFGVPESWIEKVIRAESNGQTMLGGRSIRSRAGAIGLMQLMPATWDTVRRRLGLRDNPDDPQDNILAGTFYLRLMYDRFGYPGLFAAYNAGPARYAGHLATGATLPTETLAYLAEVGGSASPQARSTGRAEPDRLFVVRREQSASRPDKPIASLFAVKNDVP